MRAGHLKGGPGDLRGARQRRRGARVDQPRPAPHQRHQEQLGLRVQVERQHGAVPVRLRRAVRVRRRGGPPVPAGHRDRDLQPVVEHRAGPDHGGARVHEPAARRVTVPLHPRQPDPVPVAGHVQRVRLADVGDPGPVRRRRDQAGPPGQPPPAGYRQVHLGPAPEYQLASFGEPDDLARRSTHMRGHRASLGSGRPSRAPPDPGIAPGAGHAVSSSWRDAGHRLWGGQPARAGASTGERGPGVLGVIRFAARRSPASRQSSFRAVPARPPDNGTAGFRGFG